MSVCIFYQKTKHINNYCICLSKMSGKRQLSILSCFQNNQLPKKVARSEDTVEEAVEEAVEETVEEVEEAVEETGENPLETEKRRGLCGAATYRCSFKKEWSTRWPFITMGTTSSFYWCSVCRQENSCAHQGVRDISRHVEGKGHRAKEQSLNSVSSIAQFYVPETSVGGMSVQEAKVHTVQCSTGKLKSWRQCLMNYISLQIDGHITLKTYLRL